MRDVRLRRLAAAGCEARNSIHFGAVPTKAATLHTMEELSKLVQSCATGDKLLTALRAADATNDLADLIVAVINELGGHPAPALPAASELCRAEFKDALCVFDSLMFLNPRCADPEQPAKWSAAPAAACSTATTHSLHLHLQFIESASRGKQQLALFPDKCVIRTAKADISVPWSAIRHVAVSCWPSLKHSP
jgi:hypothetical protein